VELVAAVVHNREEVAGLRAAARAAGVEVLGDRPGVADLADQEGSVEPVPEIGRQPEEEERARVPLLSWGRHAGR
jgi:hypothetical protein